MILKNKILMSISMGLSLLTALTLAVGYFVPLLFAEKIYPRTYAFNSSLSFEDMATAKKIIKNNLEEILVQKIPIIFNDREYLFSFSELGIEINIDQIEKQLLTIQNNNTIEFYRQSLIPKYIDVEPIIDNEKATQSLISKIPDLKISKNAQIKLNADRQIEITPEEEGYKVNYNEFASDIKTLINNNKIQKIVLEAKKDKPSLTEEKLNAYKNNLMEKISQNISLIHNEKKWTIKALDNPEWLSINIQPYYELEFINKKIPLEIIQKNADLFEADYGDLNLQFEPKIKFNEEKIKEFITIKISPEIEIKATHAKIYYNENNQIFFEGTAKNGQGIEMDKLMKNYQLAVNENLNQLEIPVSILKAQVEADEKLKNLGIKELIAVGYSNFSGSPTNRIHNIGVAMSKLNGILIPPNEIFSFNTNIGAVDGSTGYFKELVIKQGKITPEYGGGVCQVSSTVYRAAFFGGLPIVDRRAHSFAVSYYARPLGYGLDATIYIGAQDLKFKNDTPGHLLIQSFVSGSDAYIKFYGTDDAREVETQGPFITNKKPAPPTQIIYTDQLVPGQKKKQENAVEGFDAAWIRVVKKGNTAQKETFNSYYRAWAEKLLVGIEKPQEQEKTE